MSPGVVGPGDPADFRASGPNPSYPSGKGRTQSQAGTFRSDQGMRFASVLTREGSNADANPIEAPQAARPGIVLLARGGPGGEGLASPRADRGGDPQELRRARHHPGLVARSLIGRSHRAGDARGEVALLPGLGQGRAGLHRPLDRRPAPGSGHPGTDPAPDGRSDPPDRRGQPLADPSPVPPRLQVHTARGDRRGRPAHAPPGWPAGDGRHPDLREPRARPGRPELSGGLGRPDLGSGVGPWRDRLPLRIGPPPARRLPADRRPIEVSQDPVRRPGDLGPFPPDRADPRGGGL